MAAYQFDAVADMVSTDAESSLIVRVSFMDGKEWEFIRVTKAESVSAPDRFIIDGVKDAKEASHVIPLVSVRAVYIMEPGSKAYSRAIFKRGN